MSSADKVSWLYVKGDPRELETSPSGLLIPSLCSLCLPVVQGGTLASCLGKHSTTKLHPSPVPACSFHQVCLTPWRCCSSADISVRIIDLFTIKPMDAATIISNAKATGGRIITVEDHYPEGAGFGSVCTVPSQWGGSVTTKICG